MQHGHKPNTICPFGASEPKASRMNPIVYFNGEFLPKDQVHISPDDRGFLFGDGVYDVTLTYDGRLFRIEDHLERMANGLRALAIDGVDVEGLSAVGSELVKRNDLDSYNQAVYFQVTRGAAKRTHHFPPAETKPSVYASISPLSRKGDPVNGSPVITLPDIRWSRCDIKSVNLLPNCLANQAAKEASAVEAMFVRDGVVLEGTSSTFFAVFDGIVCTPPLTNYILPGITQKVVLEQCETDGIPIRFSSIHKHELQDADELFMAGTTTEVVPIVSIDGAPVRDGKPGPIALRVYELFKRHAYCE